MESMEQLLTQLEAMKDSNPEAFQQTLRSLGLDGGGGGDGGGEFESDKPFMEDKEGSIRQMAEAIEKMRREGGGSVADNPDLVMSKDGKQLPKGITITPEPGFAFKTTRLNDGMKIFVNMTQHQAVDEPAMKKKLNEDGEEVEGMNIPMSVGPPRSGTDKKGAECIIYDIIVNPIVLTESTADKSGSYREFICQLGIQYLEQKYTDSLNKQYKLPKLKYMGDEVATQYIQDRKNMPKIEELSSKKAQSDAAKGKKGAAKGTGGKAPVVEVLDTDLTVSANWVVDTNSNHQRVSGSAVFDEESEIDLISTLQPLDLESCTHRPYEHSLIEYIDPVQTTPVGTEAILLTADIGANDLNLVDTNISISPYKVVLKLSGYKKVVCYLAVAVLPASSYYFLTRPYEGCISSIRVQIVLRIDRRSWINIPDAGSKPWLVSQAISAGGDYDVPAALAAVAEGGRLHSHVGIGQTVADVGEEVDKEVLKAILEDQSSPYAGELRDYLSERHRAAGGGALFGSGGGAAAAGAASGNAAATKAAAAGGEDFPEDRFHLKLPEDVDQYTGVKLDDPPDAGAGAVAEKEEEEFAEDKFHLNDASSQFIISQREKAKKDKWEKHEKEKAERGDDPNVEYVDMDDFRPGGKYGPADKQNPAAADADGAGSEGSTAEMQKAAKVLAESQKLELEGGLSSTLWTELLD